MFVIFYISRPWGYWSNFFNLDIVGTILARKLKSCIFVNLPTDTIPEDIQKIQDYECNWTNVYKHIYKPGLTINDEICDNVFEKFGKFNTRINQLISTFKRYKKWSNEIDFMSNADLTRYVPHKDDIKSSEIDKISSLCTTRKTSSTKFTYNTDEQSIQRNYERRDNPRSEMGQFVANITIFY